MKISTLKRVNLPWKFHDAQYLTCDLHYNAGGYNWYTHAEEARGYYITVCPSSEKVKSIITLYATTGVKDIIIHCGKRTKKQDARAVEMFAQEVKRIIAIAYPDRDIDYTPIEGTEGGAKAA